MAREREVNDILLPRRRRKGNIKPKKGSGFIKFIAGLFIVLAVLLVALSFIDIGGGTILKFAQEYLAENYNLSLNAEKITGNPIKGYTLHNFELADEKNKILSAGFLSGRINFPALLKAKIRLAEISLGGLNIDVDNLAATIENLKESFKTDENSQASSTPPAVPENKDNSLPEIPLDRFSIKDSKLKSQYGIFEISEAGADLVNFDIDLDGSLNGLPIKGNIDISTGLKDINRSEINFGSGKITATGGLKDEDLDFHASFEDFDISELASLYPDALNSKDFAGKINFNIDASGTVNSPKISGMLDYNGVKIFALPVERVSANLSYSNYRLAINNIQANALNIPIQGEVAVANRPNEITSIMIKLDGTEANLAGLDKILKIPELKSLSGKVSAFNANVSGPVNALSGLVNISAPKISYEGRTVTNIKAQMKLAKSDTAQVDGKFNFEGSNGFLQGTISEFNKPKFNLTAKIANLDVKKIESMIPDASDYKLSGLVTAAVTFKGTLDKPVISGSLNSPEFSGFGQKITKPAVNFSFANKTLTLSKTEGTLNGMPVNLSGTITPLPSSNPKLNINATIAMSPASLKTYVPDINQYSLKGTINAGVKIQGTVNNPSINLLASSQNLQAMNILTAKDIELTTTAGGDLTKLEKINISASAGSINFSGVTFNDIKAAINKNGDKISLAKFNASSGKGSINGNGEATVSGKEPLNFNFNFEKLSLASLASASGVDIKGDLSGNLKISGANSNPEIFFNAGVPELNAMGFILNNLTADISGTTKSVKFNKVNANFEGSEIIALGNVQFSPLKYTVAVNGNNMKLENLIREIPALKDNLAGTAGLTFNLNGDEKGASGKGNLSTPNLKAFGMNLTNVKLPLNYSGNSFASSNGTANLYGGNLKNNFNFDIKNMKFTDNIEASGVEINNLIQDASGGLGGKITGKGKLSMKINGQVKDTASYSGSGNFSMGAGAITGFKWLDLITRIHKSNGIQYASVNAPLSLQTGKLIIKSGSIANANKNDALYKYAKLIKDGVINFGGKDVTIDFTAEGSINYQLINAIKGGSAGALASLLTGGSASLQDGLKTFISGGLKGAEQSASTGDFRVMSMRISGKAASPSFSNLKIGESTLKNQNLNQNQTQNAENSSKENVNADNKNNNKTETKQEIKEKFEDKVIDSLINVIAPNTQNKKQNSDSKSNSNLQVNEEKQKQENSAVKNQSTKDKIKSGLENALKDEKNKERLKNELKKGLGGLFK